MSRWLYHFAWNPLTVIFAVLVAVFVQLIVDARVRTDGIGAAVTLLALVPFGAVGFVIHFHGVIRSITRQAGLSFDERNRIRRIGRMKRATYLVATLVNIAIGTILVATVLMHGPEATTARLWVGAMVFACLSMAISVIEKSYLEDFQADLDDRRLARERQQALDAELHCPRNFTS